MKRLALVTLGFCLTPVWVQASVRQQIEPLFQQVQSPFMQVVPADGANPANYPLVARFLKWDLLKWSPHPEGLKLQEGCEQMPQGSADDYLGQCKKQVTQLWKDLLSNTYLTMMIDLEPQSYPRGRFVEMQLKNGTRLRGFLALKGDLKPRPLVILRLGIFSNATEFLPERYLFSQLYEQTPFHLLILESTSGSEFLARNGKVVLGGFEEGNQNFEVARRLQSPDEPFAKMISSVHMAGMSLGGHGTLMAAILNDLNATPKPVINSFLLFCPLVNLRDTMDFHRSQGVVETAINYWARFRLNGLEKVVPSEEPGNYLHNIFSYLEKQPLHLNPDLQWPQAWRSSKDTSFWKYNAFDSFLAQAKSPISVLATVKDPIVPYAFNSGRLKTMWKNRSQQVVTTLDEAYHCSLPGAYKWNFISGYAFRWIDKHSSLQWVDHQREFQLRAKVHPNWDWKVDFAGEPGASTLTVRFIESPRNWRRWFRADEQKFSLALDELDLPKVTEEIDAEESTLWQRWASLQIRPEVVADKLILRWRSLK